MNKINIELIGNFEDPYLLIDPFIEASNKVLAVTSVDNIINNLLVFGIIWSSTWCCMDEIGRVRWVRFKHNQTHVVSLMEKGRGNRHWTFWPRSFLTRKIFHQWHWRWRNNTYTWQTTFIWSLWWPRCDHYKRRRNSRYESRRRIAFQKYHN